MKITLPLAILLSASVATIADAQTAPKDQGAVAAPAPLPANYAEAYRLAQTIRDEASLMFEVSHVFEDGPLALMAQNPQIAPLEKMAPGVVAYAFRKARPQLEAVMRGHIPALWDSMARLFASSLTVAEMAQIQAYYSSPGGKRLKAAMLKHYDYSREIAPIAKDLDAKSDPNALKAGIAAAVPDALNELSAEDKAALVAFGATPAFRKLQPLNQRILEIVAAWSNSIGDSDDPAVGAAMEAAVKEYLAARGKKL